jgi:hypothetical protein
MDDSEGAIYIPPKNGLPYLVVTFVDGSLKAQPTTTRSEARVLLAQRTRRTKPTARAADDPVRLVRQ